MTDNLHQRARAVFLELSTLDGPAASSELDRLVGDDATLRAAVVSLLAARQDANDAGLMTDATTSQLSAPITESAGTIIGPYKILQLIGEGGFGSVFLAEQAQPVRRRVAIKIIKLGMDTKQVIARFEAERQALALMDHPHIARVFDAGSTDSGRPYFAMEYVVGDAITKFADDYKLDIDARLTLLAQVCSAVQHAHTKGVIHRDLKPANVLVSMVDGKPFAKVIDFGIAKATASPLTNKTLFTEHRQLIGTPEYMSPEQAEGSPDIDTRTDVYALGVLLYELLTGATPFDAARLRSAAWGEMQRIIREEDPPIPSLRLSRDAALSQRTAANRQTEPPRLASSIRGELDWIVMKALDKDRGRRYATPSDLAEDIGKHLSGDAVEAAPPSAAYKLRKFVKRNRGPVLAGVSLAAVLLLGIAGTTAGLLVAQYNADVAIRNASVAQWSAYTANLALAQNAIDAGDWSAARDYIDKCPESHRDWEWQFLDRRSRHAKFTLTGESFGVFSPDGNRLATLKHPSEFSANDRSALLQIHDLQQTQGTATLKVPDSERGFSFRTVLWSPDSTRLLTLHDVRADSVSETGRIWRADGLGEPVSLQFPSSEGYRIAAWSPDGSRVAIATGSGLRIWAADGEIVSLLAEVPISLGIPDGLAWSPVGSHLAVSNASGHLYICDEQDDFVPSVSFDAARSHRINWSPDARHIAMQTDREIRVWGAADGALIASFEPSSSFDGWTRTDGPIYWLDEARLAQLWRYGISFEWDITKPGPATPIYDPARLAADFGTLSPDGSWLIDPLSYSDMRDDLIVADARVHRPPLSWTSGDARRQQAYLAAELDSAVAWPNGAKSVSLGGRTVRAIGRLVQFLDSEGRHVASFTQEEVVDSLLADPEGSRLFIGLRTGLTYIWDIREPDEIAAQAERVWKQLPAAMAWLDTAWSGPTPTEALAVALLAGSTLSPAARLLALDLLSARADSLEDEARRAFRKLSADYTNAAAVRDAVLSLDVEPRLQAALLAKAEAWEYTPPVVSVGERLTDETRRRRLAEASLTLTEFFSSESIPAHLDPEIVAGALTARAELLGEQHPLTSQARWLYGLLLTAKTGRVDEGLEQCRMAADSMLSGADTDPFVRIGAVYNLMQMELTHGNFEAAETRFNRLLSLLEAQANAERDNALALWQVEGGVFGPFGLSYAGQVLPTRLRHYLGSMQVLSDRDERVAFVREWIERARSIGLSGLLAHDSVGYFIIDVGTATDPYGLIIPNNQLADLRRLIPDAIEVKQAHSLALLREDKFREAALLAAEVDKATVESGRPRLAMLVAVQAIAAARLGEESTAQGLRTQLLALKERTTVERGENDLIWRNSIGRFANSDRVIDLFLQELDDTLAGRPPQLK